MPTAASKPVILVVDDSRTIQMSARHFLEPDFQVEQVEDGLQALSAIIDLHPDLILLDIMMPRLDGYSVALAIKQDEDLARIPLVILSARDSPFDKARFALIGVDAYLTKPFERDPLLACVRQHLLPPDETEAA